MVVTPRGSWRPVLFIQKVLHGTNSRERRIGAKACVKHLLARGAHGGVYSHDLGLDTLEEEPAVGCATALRGASRRSDDFD